MSQIDYRGPAGYTLYNVSAGVVSVMKAEGLEEAGQLVEPQRGNEKNKQPLPVPLRPETLLHPDPLLQSPPR